MKKKQEKKRLCSFKGTQKKYRGDTKIRHRHIDNILRVSSANSKLSKAMTTRQPTEPQQIANQVWNHKNTVTPKISAASSTSTPSASTGKWNRGAPDYYRFEGPFCSVSEFESIPAPKRQRTTNPIIGTIIQETPIDETGYELQVVSLPDPWMCPPKSFPQDYDFADQKREIGMSVNDAESKIQWKNLDKNKQFILIQFQFSVM